jgi:hypothetical protein
MAEEASSNIMLEINKELLASFFVVCCHCAASAHGGWPGQRPTGRPAKGTAGFGPCTLHCTVNCTVHFNVHCNVHGALYCKLHCALCTALCTVQCSAVQCSVLGE